MRGLNSDARGVIDAAGREGIDEPSTADQARVRRSLALRLAGSAVAGASAVGVGSAKAAGLGVVSKLVLPVALTILTAAGGYYGYQASRRPDAAAPSETGQARERSSYLRPAPSAGSATKPQRATSSRSAEAVPSVEGHRLVEKKAAAAATAKTLVSARTRNAADARSAADHGLNKQPVETTSRQAPSLQPGTLEGETRLLRDAHADIRNGNAKRALARLDEYEREFGGGALAAEHRAARVLALCELGDKEAARGEAQRFLRLWPASPLAPRVRAACADP